MINTPVQKVISYNSEIHLDPSVDSDHHSVYDELVKYYLSVCSLKVSDQQK